MRPTLTTTRAEDALIHAIALRILRDERNPYAGLLSAVMDLSAVHSHGCRLDLQRLLAAEDTHFWHDVLGIARHIDRDTGHLTGVFAPRHTQGPG